MINLNKPRLIIVAGPNGSGKTTITETLLKHAWMDDCVYINPDIIAQQEFGDWNSTEAILNAANKAQQIRQQCLSLKQDMAFETVFSGPDKLEFVRQAKTAGFFIRLFFVCTNDPSINAQRVALRVMDGGHDVPIPKIIGRYYRSIANCVESLSWVDRAYFYDNSETDQDPRLLFKVSEGKLVKTYGGLTPWAEGIVGLIEDEKI
jgi:predicted ABC-type ATPase